MAEAVMEEGWNLAKPPRRPMGTMDWVKIAGFLVSFGTLLVLSLQVYSAFKDGQAAMLAELRGIHAEIGGIVRQVDRLNDAVFPVATPGRH